MDSFFSLVTFTLNNQRFGIECSLVKRIIRMVELSAIPKAQTEILGLLNVEGEIYPVIDLAKRLQIAIPAPGIDNLIILVDLQKRVFGFVVEEVNFSKYPASKLVPSNKIIQGIDYIDSIVKDPMGIIQLLALEKLVKKQDFQSSSEKSNFVKQKKIEG